MYISALNVACETLQSSWEASMARRSAVALGLFVAIAAIAGLLAGCTWLGAPATTEELLVRYVANEDASNYAANMQLDLKVTALGVTAKLPTTAHMEVADGNMHGTLTMDLSSLEVEDYTVEYYAELQDRCILCYLGTPSFDRSKVAWKRWEINTTSNIDISTLVDLLRASELTSIAKDSDEKVRYELAVPTEAVLQTVFRLFKDPVEIAGLDEQDLIDAVGSDKVRFYFTEDCLLRSASTNVTLDAKNAATNNVAVKAGVDVSMVLDDYGKTDPASLVVPDEVRQSALLVDEPIDVLDIIGPDSTFAKAVPK